MSAWVFHPLFTGDSLMCTFSNSKDPDDLLVLIYKNCIQQLSARRLIRFCNVCLQNEPGAQPGGGKEAWTSTSHGSKC